MELHVRLFSVSLGTPTCILQHVHHTVPNTRIYLEDLL